MKAWLYHEDAAGLPIWSTAAGDFDLSVIQISPPERIDRRLYVLGRWSWLVRRDGRDLAEGVARDREAAKLAAEREAAR